MCQSFMSPKIFKIQNEVKENGDEIQNLISNQWSKANKTYLNLRNLALKPFGVVPRWLALYSAETYCALNL